MVTKAAESIYYIYTQMVTKAAESIYIYIYIYIYISPNPDRYIYISVWICKNMPTEISLIYPLTEPCSGVCFFVVVFVCFCFCFCFFS